MKRWHWNVIYVIGFILALFICYTVLGLDVIDL